VLVENLAELFLPTRMGGIGPRGGALAAGAVAPEE
jgi:hypothetical protein